MAIPGMTKKELAQIAGYTYRRLYDIDRDQPQEKKLFVESEGGKYDLAIFVQRWVDYNVNNEASEVDDLDTVKARHEVVKTQKTELEVARMRGQLIDVQDVKRLWGDIANTVIRTGATIAKSATGEVSVNVVSGYEFYLVKVEKR